MAAELRENVRTVVSGQEQYPVKTKPLWVPGLDLLAPHVEAALRENYADVKVSVVDCPDLTQHGLPAAGLGGDAKLVEGGGEPFNHDPDYNRDVHFELERMAAQAGHTRGSLVFGAAAAGLKQLGGHLGELVPCLTIGGDNRTRAVRVESDTRAAIVQEDSSGLCGGISNLFLCKGEPGKVLKIEVSGRTGEQASLTQSLRSGLGRVPGVGGARQLGVGGVFRMTRGSVKAHVNPDFEVLPENYYDRDQMKCVKDFLQFYNFEAPLLCFTTLWTDEPEGPGCLNLRGSGEHTHFWREGDQAAGGHYHGDTSPAEVSYEGYFSLASELVRLWDAVEQKMVDREKYKI